MFFFIITTSIWVHELIHVYQLNQSNQDVDEVCFVGWRRFEKTNAVGWVKSTVSTNLNEKQMENHSLFIQVVYVTIIGFFFVKWIENIKS
jgi:cytoskeletal protein RodZ